MVKGSSKEIWESIVSLWKEQNAWCQTKLFVLILSAVLSLEQDRRRKWLGCAGCCKSLIIIHAWPWRDERRKCGYYRWLSSLAKMIFCETEIYKNLFCLLCRKYYMFKHFSSIATHHWSLVLLICLTPKLQRTFGRFRCHFFVALSYIVLGCMHGRK